VLLKHLGSLGGVTLVAWLETCGVVVVAVKFGLAWKVVFVGVVVIQRWFEDVFMSKLRRLARCVTEVCGLAGLALCAYLGLGLGNY